jgi:hypothetical protein
MIERVFVVKVQCFDCSNMIRRNGEQRDALVFGKSCIRGTRNGMLARSPLHRDFPD